MNRIKVLRIQGLEMGREDCLQTAQIIRSKMEDATNDRYTNGVNFQKTAEWFEQKAKKIEKKIEEIKNESN